MIPSVLAKQLQRGLSDYIETTFPITNPFFKDSIRKMLERKDAVFHEPYISIKLPFRVAENNFEFEAIHSSYKPYLHQYKAFKRLASQNPKSTLIATGTGSGKTECFLYPILEYCYKHRGEAGIKALIIYPMNALATDQAGRIAKLIYESPKLKNNVTVGLYVGGQEEHPSRIMDKEHIITDKATLLNHPPDILLTNYKMLDYLLVRPKDAHLWDENKKETLKFIAVDEFHTFDGAQGTDLACLLRRLKARLGTPKNHLCCIGTSATMGSKDSGQEIRNYAEEVFDEDFDGESIITEDRLSPFEFFEDIETTGFKFPSDEDAIKLQEYAQHEELKKYLSYATKCWLDKPYSEDEVMQDYARIDVAEQLMHHQFFRILIENINGLYVQTKYIKDSLYDKYPDIKDIENIDILVDALIALVSHARIKGLRPFLNVQVQVWFKELRRLLANVSETPEFEIGANLNQNNAKFYLPVINCRDCGATGWVSRKNERDSVEIKDFDTFYNIFFNNKKDDKIKMMFPESVGKEPPIGMKKYKICPECMKLESTEADTCTSCGRKYITVFVPILQTSSTENPQYICPYCGSKRGLSVIGMRSTTETSAILSQLFSSKFNDDKKTLAFSDNVQDAAFSAGFFNSKTWRFSLRTAIQRFAQKKGNHLSLEKFSDEFIKYYRDILSDEEFVSQFIAPNMTWMAAYEQMIKENNLAHNEKTTKLIKFIENRLRYEIMLEIGLNRKIGRTLEKSGCLTVEFDKKTIDSIASEVENRVINEVGVLRDKNADFFKLLVLNYLNVIRSNGAYNDSVFDNFVKEKGNPYRLSTNSKYGGIMWLPASQPGRNTPKFLCEIINPISTKNNFDKYTDKQYLNIISSTIGNLQVIWNEHIANISKIIFDTLKKQQILVKFEDSPNGIDVYALDKNQIYITTDTSLLNCINCGNKRTVPTNILNLYSNSNCIEQNCSGNYEQIDIENDYYNKLYNNGDIERIKAREHTGLLQREDREDLEKVFKHKEKDKKPWDTNVLSCTPTLEMGIDIGNLSSVILCSVPPAQAQYLQRVGRAGRKDGNALNIIVANTKPHDLYFYADPIDMLTGQIEPPKIFLQASAVLERQLIAFCLDSWIKSKNITENDIPQTINTCITNIEKKDSKIFPYNFFDYIQTNLTDLTQNFISLFPKMEEATKSELIAFAKGSDSNQSIQVCMYRAFNKVREQKESLRKNAKELKKKIDELKSKPKDSSYDAEMDELEKERKGFAYIARQLGCKNTFNFLSDEGLLPNYAFPEAGITLKSILYREKDNENDTLKGRKKYDIITDEYSRSASSAISEFAPNNEFYVKGHSLKIDQIDLTTVKPIRWRLCPNCSHAEPAGNNSAITSCPVCGSVGWADSGQVRSMLKFQTVYSSMSYEKSRIDDSSESRTVQFYCKQTLVDVDEDKDITQAYQMDNDKFTFGYEFIKKATIREINFGEKDDIGEDLVIAGNEAKRKGFKICKSCGKIQTKKTEHARYCKNKNIDLNNKEAYEDCLFLYREFNTEALRLLIPATTVIESSMVRQESFIAAFMLGMKKYFGNVDHLKACVSDVPIENSPMKKQYLVIYDSVPGGTGYLKQLMQKENALIEVLEKALRVVKDCNCDDGCYHCLFAYRQSKNNGEISKKVAVELLTNILKGKNNIKEIAKISNIAVNSLIETELEAKFIEVFKRLSTPERPIEIQSAMVKNKDGYRLQIADKIWEIEPQVILDKENGVSVKTKPDFILWPVGQKVKPVAVYMDGYTYHNDIVDDDTRKRMAVLKSGNFVVWSLCWNDILKKFKPVEIKSTDLLNNNQMPSCAIFNKIIASLQVTLSVVKDETQIELLLAYLANDKAETILQAYAQAYSFKLLSIMQKTENEKLLWINEVKDILEAGICKANYTIKNTKCCSIWSPNQDSYIKISAATTSEEMEKKLNATISVFAIFDDTIGQGNSYQSDWTGFWHFCNVMQFAKDFIFVSRKGLNNEIYNFSEIVENFVQKYGTNNKDQWSEILELTIDELKDFINNLISKCAKPPTSVGFEIDSGAMCEYAWEDDKVVLLTTDQMKYKDDFEKDGWKVYSISTIGDAPIFQKE